MTRRDCSLLGATIDSNDSMDGESRTEELSKRNKSTYQMRKEELECLKKEIADLEKRSQLLEAAHRVTPQFALNESIALNTLLNSEIKANHLALAGAQSMIATASHFRSPLDHYIHLPSDASSRRQALLSLLPIKAEACISPLRERTRYLDIRQPHRQMETTVLENGDFVMTLFDVFPFDGVSDLRTVYDQVMECTATQEIRLSEELGVITIRETDESPDSAVSQYRFLANISPHVEMESNCASFSRFIKSTDRLTPTFGFGVSDYVDNDEQHPYEPSSRLRRDFTACCLVSETPPDPSDTLGDGLPGVSMVRWASVRIHSQLFPISKRDEAAARTYVMQWPDVMVKTIQDRLELVFNFH